MDENYDINNVPLVDDEELKEYKEFDLLEKKEDLDKTIEIDIEEIIRGLENDSK